MITSIKEWKKYISESISDSYTIDGIVFKKSSMTDVIEFETRGSIVVNDDGDKVPDEKTMNAAKKLVTKFKELGYKNSDYEPQEKGWVSVFMESKRNVK